MEDCIEGLLILEENQLPLFNRISNIEANLHAHFQHQCMETKIIIVKLDVLAKSVH